MKRIPGFVDAGGTSVGATYCGKSVCRKVTGYREKMALRFIRIPIIQQMTLK